METSYDSTFYAMNAAATGSSAEAVAPIIVKLANRPQSVIDVGCSSGQWLVALRAAGVPEIRGIDGEWIDLEQSNLAEEEFERRDLSQPFTVDREFDLATTFEVAEHLPPESAKGFVASLVKLAPIVVFSASIPGQGGHHHLNEQWPPYWAAYFAEHDYVAFDPIRPLIWDDDRVIGYYRQNIGVFVHRDKVDDLELGEPGLRAMVHPNVYTRVRKTPPIRKQLRERASKLLGRS